MAATHNSLLRAESNQSQRLTPLSVEETAQNLTEDISRQSFPKLSSQWYEAL